MKKGSLPDAYKKRKLLNDDKLPQEKLIAFGEIHLEHGRLYEAAEFFRKASHKEGLERIRDLAIESGDGFVYSIVADGSEADGDSQGWEALGKRAMELKKYAHAVRAFHKAGNDALKIQAEEAIKGLNKGRETGT